MKSSEDIVWAEDSRALKYFKYKNLTRLEDDTYTLDVELVVEGYEPVHGDLLFINDVRTDKIGSFTFAMTHAFICDNGAFVSIKNYENDKIIPRDDYIFKGGSMYMEKEKGND